MSSAVISDESLGVVEAVVSHLRLHPHELLHAPALAFLRQFVLDAAKEVAAAAEGDCCSDTTATMEVGMVDPSEHVIPAAVVPPTDFDFADVATTVTSSKVLSEAKLSTHNKKRKAAAVVDVDDSSPTLATQEATALADSKGSGGGSGGGTTLLNRLVSVFCSSSGVSPPPPPPPAVAAAEEEEAGFKDTTTPLKYARARRPWSAEEDEWLRRGVARCGVGSWSHIAAEFGTHFRGRDNVALKDRWRNLSRLL